MGFLDRIIGYGLKQGGAYLGAMSGKAGALIAEKNGVKVFEKILKNGNKHIMSFKGTKLQKVVKIKNNNGIKNIESINFNSGIATKTKAGLDRSGFPPMLYVERSNYNLYPFGAGIQIGKTQNLVYEFCGHNIRKGTSVWHRI